MEILTYIIKGIFIAFLIYTYLYICMWIAGIITSNSRLSDYKEKQTTVRKIFPDQMAQTMPVGVLIPSYNEKACIGDTVKSLLENDYPVMDIIVVDDGSTDHTEESLVEQLKLKQIKYTYKEEIPTEKVIRCYGRVFEKKRVLYVIKENGGKSDALNCGLNFCRYPHCLVLDADTHVEKNAVRIMAKQFLMDKRTIVCAGTVGDSLYKSFKYKKLKFAQKALVLFQKLEYYRTFYMQRIMFDHFNANLIVSGAFAMFDAELVKCVGGYRTDTIGEDMELTMRLHAFCKSQRRPYKISFVPEARCSTEIPFSYRDYFNQRRRWHIGMIQSLKNHFYMIGQSYYGWAGIAAGTVIMFYELIAPFVEILGFITLMAGYAIGIVNIEMALKFIAVYLLFIILTQGLLINALRCYGVEKIKPGEYFLLECISVLEFLFFHPLNMFIKLSAFAGYKRHKETWNHITRKRDE